MGGRVAGRVFVMLGLASRMSAISETSAGVESERQLSVSGPAIGTAHPPAEARCGESLSFNFLKAAGERNARQSPCLIFSGRLLP